MARFRVRFRGPVSRQVVSWLERLIPVLRDAPPEIQVTVEIDAVDEPDAEDEPPR